MQVQYISVTGLLLFSCPSHLRLSLLTATYSIPGGILILVHCLFIRSWELSASIAVHMSGNWGLLPTLLGSSACLLSMPE